MNVLLTLRPSRRLAILAASALFGPVGCDPQRGGPQMLAVPKQAEPPGTPMPPPGRAGISVLEPGADPPDGRRTVDLPADPDPDRRRRRPGPAVGDVNVRNTDESRPILLTVVRHRDADGNTVRDYLRAPVRLAPGDPGPRRQGPRRSRPRGERPGRMGRRPRREPADGRGPHDRPRGGLLRRARPGHRHRPRARRPAEPVRLSPRPVELHHRPDRPVLGPEPRRDEPQRRERAGDPVDVDHEPRPDLPFQRVLAAK